MGSAVVGVGAAVASGRWSAAVLIALYLASTIAAAIRTEEAGMRAAFGDQYDAYVEARANRIERRFSLSRAMKNKEYRAVAGLLVVGALLALKAGLRQ
jgi:RES domain-containing protein